MYLLAGLDEPQILFQCVVLGFGFLKIELAIPKKALDVLFRKKAARWFFALSAVLDVRYRSSHLEQTIVEDVMHRPTQTVRVAFVVRRVFLPPLACLG